MGYIKHKFKEYYDKQPPKAYPEKLLSPSMLGGCPRVMYYQLNDIKQTTPPDCNAQMNFQVGHLWEMQTALTLDKLGVLINWWCEGQDSRLVNTDMWSSKEVLRKDKWIDEELHIAGTPDILYYQDGKVVLLDSKTASEGKSSKVAKLSDEEFWRVEYGHKMQLGAYLILQKRRYEAGLEKHKVDYGKLVIFSKDNGHIIKEPVLFYSEQLEKEVLNRCNELWHFISNNIKPPCTCNIENEHNFKKWRVSYCNYGNVDSMQPNYKKKIVPTKCCEL